MTVTALSETEVKDILGIGTCSASSFLHAYLSGFAFEIYCLVALPVVVYGLQT